MLILRGYFLTEPSRVNYHLEFMRSDGEWKLSPYRRSPEEAGLIVTAAAR